MTKITSSSFTCSSSCSSSTSNRCSRESASSKCKTNRSSCKTCSHSSKTTKETQWTILNHMIDEMQKYDKDDFVIFDRCPLDNLVYTLWSYHKNTSDIDELFVEKCIPVIRESFRLLDIIFLVPITNVVKDDI